MKRNGIRGKTEKARLALHIGYARGPAAENVSGDTVLSCRLPDGRRAVILSDGMGRGAPAAAESRLAAAGLARRLRQGMPVARAAGEVNRYLLRRFGGAEGFATVDLLLIDERDGAAVFYKMGAAPSYLLRQGRVEKVERAALPVGIVPGPVPRRAACRLAGGDIIVMMSDGVCDAGRRGGGRDWVASYLRSQTENGSSLGPRQLAERLLEEARRRSRRFAGEEPDDATVAVIMIED